ncbi:hypothetical protein [Oleiagrimonas sp. MCCC 1A03011]|uniref:hypothetical protein n=1 Tax=Oleiagrimonas sp. MCCC 1A03011 TaxID=1926883 RepID=UPI0011BE570E|nr:hypothetical protein [Oleiagrimonas sp. MCCC 1A03011]
MHGVGDVPPDGPVIGLADDNVVDPDVLFQAVIFMLDHQSAAARLGPPWPRAFTADDHGLSGLDASGVTGGFPMVARARHVSIRCA